MSEEISELAKRLSLTIKEIDWLGQKVHPEMREKATADEMKKLAEKLGRPVPETYAAFLQTAGGIEGADILQWTINGATPPTKGESIRGFQQEVVAALKTYDKEDPTIGLLENAHVVATDFHNEIVVFDPSVKNGEPKLLRISMDGTHEGPFETFEALLAHVVDYYNDQLAMFDDPALDYGGGGSMGGGGGGGGSFSGDEAQLLKELASLLDGTPGFGGEPEPEPELQISPEMQLAARLCEHVIDQLVAARLVELIDAPGCRENLEDYMLRKLMRSRREDQVLDNWIHALGKAREVEELYGTDDELKKVMQDAWNEIAEEQEKEQNP